MASTKEEMIMLKSSDEKTFEIDREVALMSGTIKHILAEDFKAKEAVPLLNVTGDILSKVIEYCNGHMEAKTKASKTSAADVGGGSSGSGKDKEDDAVTKFDKEFVKELEKETLFGLIMAANYLDIKCLMNLACQTVADMIKNMSISELRNIFNIQNDFTEEEEAEVRRANAWAFE